MPAIGVASLDLPPWSIIELSNIGLYLRTYADNTFSHSVVAVPEYYNS